MNLKDDLKRSLQISNNTTVINDQTYKTMVETCFLELCRETDVPNISKLHVSKPDVTKELHAALLAFISECARNDLKPDSMSSLLTNECNFPAGRAKCLAESYEKHRVKLQIVLGNIGSHLPNVIDVKWKMDYVTKSSEVGARDGPVFRVSLVTERLDEATGSNTRDTVDFLCTSQELQDLVYKLREAMRHCMRIATER